MADITVTPANVKIITATASQLNSQYTAFEDIDAGEAVYRRAADNQWGLLECAAAATAEKNGETEVALAVNSAALGQRLTVAKAGARVQLGTGATLLTVGKMYTGSRANAGKIAPVDDYVATDKPVYLGYAPDADDILLTLDRTGVSHG